MSLTRRNCRFLSFVSAAAAVSFGGFVLIGCGGGGSVRPAPTTTPAPSASPTPAPTPSSDTVRGLSLFTGDLVYNAQTGQIIASVPSLAGADGDFVVSFDPETLEIGSIIPVGSEPGKLALADNNRDLYVGLNGAAAVQRVNLETGTAGLIFSLGQGYEGAYYPADIAVMPHNPDVVAVALKNPHTSPHESGVAIYDNGVPRMVTVPAYNSPNAIAWGTGNRLYGYGDGDASDELQRFEVSASGVTLLDFASNVVFNPASTLVFDNGRIYADDGIIADGEAKNLIGRLGAFGLVRPDSVLKRVWVLTYPSGPSRVQQFTVTAYDTDTLQEVGSQTITGVSGTPASFIRWGRSGLAFRVSEVQAIDGQVLNGQVIIIPSAPGLQ